MQQAAAAPAGEVVEFTLGHRLRDRQYLVQPVALTRSARGSARFVVRCLGCGQPITVSLEDGGAAAGWRALFWRWNFSFAIILNLVLGLAALVVGAIVLPSLLADLADDPSGVGVILFPAVFIGVLCLVSFGGALFAITRLVAMRADPRIIDDGDRQTSAALLGNFMLDQSHHLLTRDGTRRLLTERLRSSWGWFGSLRVDSATPYPPTQVPPPFAPGVPVAVAPAMADPAAWGGALGRAHAAEAIRTGVFLSGDGLAAFARQTAQAAAASLRVADPSFAARYAEAYVAAYGEGVATRGQG